MLSSWIFVFQSEPPTVPSIWKQQGPAIVGDNAGDYLGWAVDLSADSKTLVVGAPGFDKKNGSVVGNKGYVKVYHMDNNGWSWMQLGQTIKGEVLGDVFGYSVDITADGKRLAIGLPGNYLNDDRPGHVRVYHLESSGDLGFSWKQLGQDINGEVNAAMFGNYVSLSDDGRTLAVGALFNNGNGEDAGRVMIYQLVDNGRSWEQLGQNIDGNEGDQAGYYVSMSADGTTVAVRAPWNCDNGRYSGNVRIYRFDSEGSNWEKLGQTFHGEMNDFTGSSVDITADGKMLAVGFSGFPAIETRQGYVRVYSLESSDNIGFRWHWKQLGGDILGEAIGDEFGTAVSLSDNGKTLAVRSPNNNGNGDLAGHVRVY
jgi:hypothetical protein